MRVLLVFHDADGKRVPLSIDATVDPNDQNLELTFNGVTYVRKDNTLRGQKIFMVPKPA